MGLSSLPHPLDVLGCADGWLLPGEVDTPKFPEVAINVRKYVLTYLQGLMNVPP